MYAHTRGFGEWAERLLGGHLLALFDLLTTTSNSLGQGEASERERFSWQR